MKKPEIVKISCCFSEKDFPFALWQYSNDNDETALPFKYETDDAGVDDDFVPGGLLTFF